jgi:hypothetical protein
VIPRWLAEFPKSQVDLQWTPSIPSGIQAVASAEALRSHGCLHSTTLQGLPSTDILALVKCAEASGGKLIFHANSESADRPAQDESWIFSVADALVRITPSTADVEVHISSGRPDEIERLAKALRPALERSAVSRIHVLRSNNKGGWSCAPAGRFTEPLQRDNYASPIQEDFDHVVSEFSSPQPCGRLILLDGPPGTGKTRLVRGIAAAVQGSAFLIVPVSLASQMGCPDLVDVLLTLRRSGREGMPIVIVVEDADSCLVPRQADNANAMAELLNATDGIWGDALNLRVIATTNAKHSEIDTALLRPGRLCRRMPVGLLCPEHASRVFQRLVGAPRSFEKPVSLAEVYAVARAAETSSGPAGRLHVA